MGQHGAAVTRGGVDDGDARPQHRPLLVITRRLDEEDVSLEPEARDDVHQLVVVLSVLLGAAAGGNCSIGARGAETEWKYSDLHRCARKRAQCGPERIAAAQGCHVLLVEQAPTFKRGS